MIKELIFAFIGTLCFAVTFEIKPRNIAYCGLCGGAGWIAYSYFLTSLGVFRATFIASVVIIALARVGARILKTPAPIFYIPGIFPIVPGAGIFNTVYSLVNEDWDKVTYYGNNTIKTAFAIALGVSIISLFPYKFRRKRQQKALKL